MSTSFSSFGLKTGWLHVWWALFLAPVSVASVRVVLAQEEQTVFETRVVVVQFEPGIVIGAGAAKTGLTAFDRTVARYQVDVIERAFPFLDYVEPTRKTAKNLAALRRTYYVRYRTETDPARVARTLSAVQGVVYAEPVLVNHVFDSAPQTDPSDSFYDHQTYLRHMRLPEAWDLVKGEDGTPPVVIAIVDGGSDWRHEDLLANVWTNEDEIPDNGIDDDANGFIDDVHGANFANGDEMNHDPKPQPGEDHGTLVAGAASAVTDNATGLAGTAWNAELMHVNAACWDTVRAICHGYQGILYAAINGADIINASWGAFSGGQKLKMEVQILDLATDMGALVVAAAGNENINNDLLPSYPSAYHRVLSVGATERNSRRRAEFSQYGRTVNVFAPGVDIITTSPGNQYSFSTFGTSFSTPLVSGVAALIKTRFPEISPDALREQLRLSSENMDAENPGYVGQLGSGYVNAEASLQAATVPGVRVRRWSWSDADGDGRIDPGDHVTIDATVVNYLADARSLTVELVAAESYPFITMTAAEYQVGSLERDDSTEVTFQFEVAADASPNKSAQFYVRIRDGAFTDEVDAFYFSINRRPDLVHMSLSALYVATDGDNWTNNTGWDITMVPTEEEFSRWYGVETLLGGVIELNLPGNNLTGTLPVEWGGLSELEILALFYNSLSGPIPAELGQLSELRILGLENNSLSGPMPAELGQLSELEVLVLENNSLSGPVPAELGQLSELEVLVLGDNSLTGQLPRSFMQLDSLQYFNFGGQDLCAPSDDEFQTWLRSIPNVFGSTCGVVDPVSFTDRVADQSFPRAQTIAPIILPKATGGVPPIVYSLSPALPTGLTFDATTRTISGTPTVVTASMPYTYKATGAGRSAATLEFNIAVVSPVHVENEALPEVFAIHGNYPNPFRDGTRLVLDLPWPAHVAVEVLDVTGRRVLTLPAVALSAGWERSLELRGEALSSGLYLYRLIAMSSEGVVSTHVGRFIQIR